MTEKLKPCPFLEREVLDIVRLALDDAYEAHVSGGRVPMAIDVLNEYRRRITPPDSEAPHD